MEVKIKDNVYGDKNRSNFGLERLGSISNKGVNKDQYMN